MITSLARAFGCSSSRRSFILLTRSVYQKIPKMEGEQSKMSWIWWTLVAIIGANVVFFGFLVVKMILDERRPRQ